MLGASPERMVLLAGNIAAQHAPPLSGEGSVSGDTRVATKIVVQSGGAAAARLALHDSHLSSLRFSQSAERSSIGLR